MRSTQGEGAVSSTPVMAGLVPAIHVLATSKAAPGLSLPSGEGGTRERDGWGVARSASGTMAARARLAANTPPDLRCAPATPRVEPEGRLSPEGREMHTSSNSLTSVIPVAAKRRAGTQELSPERSRYLGSGLGCAAPERQRRSMRGASLLILSLDNKPKVCLCGGVLFRWGALARRRDVGQHCSCELACLGRLG